VNDAILAGSDSIVVDGAFDIYVGSYVGIAKITASADPNNFAVESAAGDIYANPIGWPWPEMAFCNICADTAGGILYYGASQLDNNTYQYGDYYLYDMPIAPARTTADFNGDGIVDVQDLLAIAEHFCECGQDLRADVNSDGLVNYLDFAMFAWRWQQRAPWCGQQGTD